MWRVTAGQSLRMRGWDAEFVLYNDLSGDTHLLGAGAIHLLRQLQCGPADEASLRATCAPEADDGHDDALAGLLDELASLSLIERAAC